MAKYESKVNMIPQATAEQVYNVLTNLSKLKPIFDNAPDNPIIRQKVEEAGQDPAVLDKLREVEITDDSFSVAVPMLGRMTFAIAETEENRCVRYAVSGLPFETNVWVQVLPVSAGGSKMRITLKAELNMMLKMMVGSKLQQAVDGFAQMLATLPYQLM